MGSAKVSNAKPQTPMENKSIKPPFLASFKNWFQKKEKAKHEKDHPKPKPKNVTTKKVPKNDTPKEMPKIDAVASILESFQNELNIKEKELKTHIELKDHKTSESEKDEFTNFTFNVIEDDDRTRHSSEDSGFSEAKEDTAFTEAKEDTAFPEAKEDAAFSEAKEDAAFPEAKEDDVTESFDKLKIEDGEQSEHSKKEEEKEKKKKPQQIFIARGKTQKCKIVERKPVPYPLVQHDLEKFRQISQINKHALSGGQVLVNASPVPDNYNEVDIALKQVEKISQTSINQSEYWQDVEDLITAESQKAEDFLKDFFLKENEKTEDFLNDFKEFVAKESFEACVPNAVTIPNVIEEFSASHHLPNYEDSIDLNNSLLSFENVSDNYKMDYIFPTPPRSENVPSPMSESQASFYPPNWENSRSPERSSPIYNSDYEKYQDISQFEELSPISEEKEEKKRERTTSISSMTMKNFKDMQKDISNEFSKKDCCQINRKNSKELFDEHMSKLKSMERKNLCFKVSKMDLKTAYGVLHHVLQSLSTGSEQEDLQYALFALVCQRVLAQSPALFVGDYGLSLLKSAVMRCPHRPLLTRFIVHYVYAALKQETTAAAQECIFPEVDAQGDNLIIACARGGDAYALVLAEITRSDIRGDQPPLFRIHHANADGYTALHVACSLHSAASPRLHTQHVLLEHSQADVWKGDIKGGDTALHLAVNSVNCDLRVIMMIFKQLDRKMWKKLAHCQNMSSVTPLEYARSATKSTTRQNYPQEVLDFLKKCR